MDVRLEPWQPDDLDALVEFLTGDRWPFHAQPQVEPDDVRARAAAGYYLGPDTETSWIAVSDGDTADDRAGVVRVFDLDDPTPVFDLRVRAPWRGRGVGRAALRAATDHVFTTRPGARRFEGHTRDDNLAMQRVLAHCGFVQEAHYREGWVSADGSVHDSLGFAILRRDWESGTTTAVPWSRRV